MITFPILVVTVQGKIMPSVGGHHPDVRHLERLPEKIHEPGRIYLVHQNLQTGFRRIIELPVCRVELVELRLPVELVQQPQILLQLGFAPLRLALPITFRGIIGDPLFRIDNPFGSNLNVSSHIRNHV